MTPHSSPPSQFEDQVLPLRPDLHRAALRYTRNRADADDLVQDTLARAFAAWPRFQAGSNVRAWLLRILSNSFISGYRRQKRRRQFAARGEEAVRVVYGTEAVEPRHPVAVLCERSLGDEVVEALAELGPDFRRVVELADLRGARYKDIAAELGVPVGTVMSRLFRARRQLEARLEGYAARDYGIRRAA